MAVRVEPAGRLVRTTSPYVDGRTVTMFELDLEQLLGDDKFFSRLQASQTEAETSALLKGAAGLKVSSGGDVVIEFSSAK